MSDPVKAGTEGQTPAIDLTQYVPKVDFEKAQTTSKGETDRLKSELEQAKMSLLDPEYISYLEAKKARIDKGAHVDIKDGELDKLSPKQLLDVAVTKAVELVEEKHADRFRRIEQTLSDTLGVLELQAVEKKYSDFGDYRDEVIKLLEDPKSNLTIEQAYKLAKSDKPASSEGEADASKKPDAKKPSGEKPSGSPSVSFKAKDFKDAGSASLDAWDQIVGAGKDTL